MKKVLQISNYMYPNIGGIEQTAKDIADALLDDEIEQKIICFNEDASDGAYVCHRKETIHDKVDGIDVIRCGCIAKIASQSISLTYPAQLKQVITQFRPDILILHYPNPYVSSFLIKYLKHDIKFILYWHLDITKQKILRRLFHRQTIKLLERADVIVATSPNYIEGSPYLSQYREKCIVIPSCIDENRLKVTESVKRRIDEIRQKYKEKTLCFACGRHVSYKGLTYLIQASKLLPDSFHFCIGGKGELTEQLKHEAADDHKVEFLGRISDEDLVAYMNACDIFCFPSITKNEAFGLALAEGMYCGKPAVTFTIPGSGVNFVNLDGITGIECKNTDSKGYAEALMKLGSSQELCTQYGKSAQKRVLDNFTKALFTEHIHSLIASI